METFSGEDTRLYSSNRLVFLHFNKHKCIRLFVRLWSCNHPRSAQISLCNLDCPVQQNITFVKVIPAG